MRTKNTHCKPKLKASRLLSKAHAQRQSEADHHAFVPHSIRGPQDDAFRAAFRTADGGFAGEFLPQPVAEMGWQDIAVNRVEVTPSRQSFW